MRNTFRSLGAVMALALACSFAAFAAPPGNVTHPVNIGASATQATRDSATPALAGELQGFKITAPVMGSTLDGALSGRLRISDGWDGYTLNEGASFASRHVARVGIGGGAGDLPIFRRT